MRLVTNRVNGRLHAIAKPTRYRTRKATELIWQKWLSRRSQKALLDWEAMQRLSSKTSTTTSTTGIA
jgi:hypothetical protein